MCLAGTYPRISTILPTLFLGVVRYPSRVAHGQSSPIPEDQSVLDVEWKRFKELWTSIGAIMMNTHCI